MTDPTELQNLAVNIIRFLSVDGVQQANSRHPGPPMGTVPMAHTIWTRHLRPIRAGLIAIASSCRAGTSVCCSI